MRFLLASKLRAGQAFMLGLLAFVLYLGACVFPPFPWLIFLAFVPLFYTLKKTNRMAEGYRIAFIFGCAIHAIALFWITNVSWFLFGLAVLFQAFITGLLGTGIFFYKKWHQGVPFCFLVAALWVLTEFIRASGFWGLPAGLVGYALTPYFQLTQIASWTGIWGLSYLIILVNALLAEAVVSQYGSGRKLKLIIFACMLVFVSYLIGTMLQQKIPRGSFNVTVIQPNIAKENKKGSEFWPQNLKIYRTMTKTALSSKESDLVIWPETAVPFFLFHEARSDILKQVRDSARSADRPLLLGAQDFQQDSTGPHGYNIAVLISQQGQIMGRYAKMKLVPVLEYMPIRLLIPWVRRMGGIGVYEPGREHTLFSIGDTTFSSLICFEGLFPGVVRKFVNKGADFLINLTNDEPSLGRMGFYYDQNARMLRIRAIENRRSFVRVANNGISMVIDPWGRVIRQAPAFSRVTFTCPVPISDQRTPYLLFGDWLIWICMFGLVMGYVFPSMRKDK